MNVAFIPVRGGSKSIPLKNIKLINGRPLVYWTIKASCGCKYIDRVYVATDSDKIKHTVEAFRSGLEKESFSKLEIIERSAESASDTASTEFAMLEFAQKYTFDNIVLVQATSPLLESSDIDRGFETFYSDDTDSVLSVVRQKRFLWNEDENGIAHPINYDVFNRPRRQEFNGYLVENGAFYITSKQMLLESQNRVSGKIKAIEMKEDSFWEIDEPSDWLMIETLMKKNSISISKNKFDCKMFLADCDGCLTDGGMYYSEYGDELKKFNTRDGMGFALLRKAGIITGIITSEDVKLNERRAQKMKIDILKAKCTNKYEIIKELCDIYKVSPDNVVYIGDDINDLEAIQNVGLGCCPADAVSAVKDAAKYVAKANGGTGVIREIADMILTE